MCAEQRVTWRLLGSVKVWGTWSVALLDVKHQLMAVAPPDSLPTCGVGTTLRTLA